MKLFDRFDKVYCINLDRRPDRMVHFEDQVKKYDLGEFERFSAYDGKKLNIKNHSSNIKLGELGLVLSNLEILNICKNKNYNNVLIIEDDCLFTDEVLKIEEYFELLPSDWDMLYMGGNHNTHVGSNPPIKINEKVSKLTNTYSTHFVGINGKIFDELIFSLSLKNQPLDVTYTLFQKNKNVYSFYPGIANQLVDFSDIQNKITDYNWLIK
jgi:GR25 family glycosyltransferase involved in LPS biosynthesis